MLVACFYIIFVLFSSSLLALTFENDGGAVLFADDALYVRFVKTGLG